MLEGTEMGNEWGAARTGVKSAVHFSPRPKGGGSVRVAVTAAFLAGMLLGGMLVLILIGGFK